MQIQNINSKQNFGLMPIIQVPDIPPAIVSKVTNLNPVTCIRQVAQSLETTNLADCYSKGTKIAAKTKRFSPLPNLEEVIKNLMALKKEVPEYTDPRIKLVRRGKRRSEPIVTHNLKTPGRQITVNHSV